MNEPDSPSGSKKKPDLSDSSGKKHERKGELDEPKPRIVLTFRSEKPGAKSTMKIVSSEEKHEKVEETSPRRSSRSRMYKYDTEEETEPTAAAKKDKNQMGDVDETVSSNSKRVTRGRSKDVDNAPNIAPPTRLSRRIKPTAKVLENEELRIGVESQNNARLGLNTDKVDKSPEEAGVRTRRSVRSKQSAPEESLSVATDNIKAAKTTEPEEVVEDGQDNNQVLKLKHLCELGLKARSPDEIDEIIEVDGNAAVDEEDVIELDEDESEPEPEEHESELEEDQEIDDDTEVITKLLEDDDDADSDYSAHAGRGRAQRGSEPARERHRHDRSGDNSATENGEPVRRSPRKRRYVWWEEADSAPLRRESKRTRRESAADDDISEPANGSAGSEAARPEDGAVATCTCEVVSNLYAASEDITEEPVFCQAIESVDGVRVGCSHGARRSGGGAYGQQGGGAYSLQRAGPRAPYIRTCALHHRQMARHMCCTTCGMFCTQGIFYQCSLGHLFHVECGLPFNDTKRMPPGCPHCGLRQSDRCEPVSRACAKVRVDMHCSNQRVFMHDQREHCTTAYLGFASLPAVDDSPVIPEELLPSAPVDLKRLCQRPDLKAGDQNARLTELHDAIVAGEGVDQLLPKIMSVTKLNALLPSGNTCLHAACKSGNVAAVYLLHYAGADLNVCDAKGRTPLIVAVTAMLEKPESKSTKKSKSTNSTDDKDAEDPESDDKDQKEDSKMDDKGCESETERVSEDDLMKVIRYLVAAGCDVNVADPEGMTALHVAAQHGGAAVCRALLSGAAAVDARDGGGWTPLVWAAENNHADTVRLLLSHGADPLAVDSEGNAAVHWCALAGAARALLVLLDGEPRAVCSTNSHADTPLHVAARQGHYACVVILLARGAKSDVENSAGSLPVEVCSGQCQTAISLNMQMALALRDSVTRRRVLNSDISRGREPYPVPVVNELDDAPPPDDFTYVTQHVMPENIVIDNSLATMQGCGCTDGDCSRVECACISLGVRRWTAGARLRPGFPHHDPPMLFLCNATCSCDARKCTNMALAREMAKGSLYVRAEVFRAGGARGWGLRAACKIPSGTLVATYCGELMPVATADARSNDQYLFALHVKPDLLEQCTEKTQLCVDACAWGGAARFINHSCRPSLACVRVFTTTRDLRLPQVALFATRPIDAGEELTFDYGDRFWSVKSKWMRCECGEAECRYTEVKGDADNAMDGEKQCN